MTALMNYVETQCIAPHNEIQKSLLDSFQKLSHRAYTTARIATNPVHKREANAYEKVAQYIASQQQAQHKLTTGTTDLSEGFLRGLQDLTRQGELQPGIVAVYKHIGGLISERRLSDCDRLLSLVCSYQLSRDLLLSFLMATARVRRDLLPCRVAFFVRVKARFDYELGPQQTSELLKNLA